MNESVFKIIQTEENVWRIETEIVRSWLFVGTQKALLADTTEVSGDLPALVRTVTDLPVQLVITHADPDHIGSNDRFDEAFMHPAEFAYYKKNAGDKFAKPRSLPDGEKIDIGGRVFEVIHIPGHTPGSIALLDRKNRLLVGGDTISERGIFLFGEGRDIPDFQNSLRRLKELSGEFDRIFTSHGEYCVGISMIENERLCLEECLAGKVAPIDPPFPVPAKLYCSHGTGFILNL